MKRKTGGYRRRLTALGYLRSLGLQVEMKGDKIRLRPKERVTPGIKQYAKAHKQEIIQELQIYTETVKVGEFATSGFAMKVYSEVLSEEIYIASDKEIRDLIEGDGLAVYLPHELSHLVC